MRKNESKLPEIRYEALKFFKISGVYKQNKCFINISNNFVY